MRNRSEIRGAIEEYLDNTSDTLTVLAEKLGITKAAMSFIRSGKTKTIKHQNWVKLEPLLRQYLPDTMTASKRGEAVNVDALWETATPMEKRAAASLICLMRSDDLCT